MSRQRKKDYKAVFHAVLELAPSLALEEMVTDFEEAIWRAAAHALPDVAVRGCNFHFSQALLRQVGELGLKRAYCKQGVVQDYIELLFALPYLAKEHIRPTFNRIAKGANDPLKPLISYVDKQWFHKFTQRTGACTARQHERTMTLKVGTTDTTWRPALPTWTSMSSCNYWRGRPTWCHCSVKCWRRTR